VRLGSETVIDDPAADHADHVVRAHRVVEGQQRRIQLTCGAGGLLAATGGLIEFVETKLRVETNANVRLDSIAKAIGVDHWDRLLACSSPKLGL
jgi:hypothetical protein